MNGGGTSASSDEDDEGFAGYVPRAINLGGGLLGGTIVALFVAWGIILPLLVILGNRRQAAEKSFITDDLEKEDDNEHPSKPTSAKGYSDNHNNDDDNNITDDQSTTSQKSSSSHSSAISSAVAAILDHPRVPKSKSKRRRKRMKEKQMLTNNWNTNGSNNSTMNDPTTVSLLQAIHPGAMTSSHSDFAPAGAGANKSSGADSGAEDLFIDTVSRPEFSPSSSDKVAVIATAAAAGYPPSKNGGDGFDSLGILDRIAKISSWDAENKRIIKLCIPFCTQALITGLTDTMNMAIIGKLIGTREVTAYVIVNLLVEMTSEFVGGFHEALATLCSQAIGARNNWLAGQYVQIVAVLYTAFFIPFMILWAIYMDATLEWLGFDEETVQIGVQYTYIIIVDEVIDGLGEAIHGLLDVCGLENFSTLIGATEEVLAFIVLLLVALYADPDLNTVGLIQLGIGIFFLILNVIIIYLKGWFLPYRKGLIGSFALWNGKAVWLVCKTAMSLSFGTLLADGEWEILTVLASYMGPAEVAAFGLLGEIWDASNELFDGISDAAEVRCAYLLGGGEPDRARLSAYKSIMVITFAALFLTSLIYIAGDDLPTWLTNDPALQHILRGLLPLFGIGNFVMGLDTMGWTLLGSQGRYRLATIIVCLVSWTVTLPLAALFTVHFKVNLEGQMAAFIIGYLVTGIIHFYYVFCSDWYALSKTVMEDNEAALLITEVHMDAHPSSTNSSTTPPRLPSQSLSSTSTSAASQGSPMFPMEVSSGSSAKARPSRLPQLPEETTQ